MQEIIEQAAQKVDPLEHATLEELDELEVGRRACICVCCMGVPALGLPWRPGGTPSNGRGGTGPQQSSAFARDV
jgi:hypothetical protein